MLKTGWTCCYNASSDRVDQGWGMRFSIFKNLTSDDILLVHGPHFEYQVHRGQITYRPSFVTIYFYVISKLQKNFKGIYSQYDLWISMVIWSPSWGSISQVIFSFCFPYFILWKEVSMLSSHFRNEENALLLRAWNMYIIIWNCSIQICLLVPFI